MAILTDRNIRKSVIGEVVRLFRTPPGGSGLSAYSVYNESQLRQVQSNGLTITRPAVFVIDTYIRPAEPTLPIISVETNRVRRRPFEVGNRKGRLTEVILHVFGRMRGERDDLGSFLADQWGAGLPIYDYTSGSTLVENATVSDEIVLEQVSSRMDTLRQESTLDLWQMVSFDLLTIN